MLLHFSVFSQTKGEKWGEMKIFLLFSFIYYKKRLTLQKIPYCVLLRLRKGCLANVVGNSLGRGRCYYWLYVNIITNLLRTNALN